MILYQTVLTYKGSLRYKVQEKRIYFGVVGGMAAGLWLRNHILGTNFSKQVTLKLLTIGKRV